MRIKVLLSFVSILFVVRLSGFAQAPIWLEAKTKYGFIVPHHKEIRYLIDKHIVSYDLRIGLQTDGKKSWQSDWNFPEFALGFYYANINETFGKSYAIYLLNRIPLYKNRIYTLNFDFSTGCAYLTNPFSPQENVENFVIGSHYNIFANAGFENIFHFDDYALQIGASWTHYSNGGTKMPNLGINISGLDFGFIYYIKRVDKKRKKRLLHYKSKTEFTTYSVMGRHHRYLTEPKFWNATFITEFGWQYSPRSKFLSGLDITSVQRVKYFYADSSFKAMQFAPYIAYAAVFGKVEFIFKQAFAVKNVEHESPLYQEFGYRAEVWKDFVLTLTLKTVWFNAQSINFGVGYRLHFGKSRT